MARNTAQQTGKAAPPRGGVPLASSETARHMNRDVILELIRRHQPVSRADLSRLSGLQRSTVSLIAEQLMGERWVREGAVAQLPRGRRPTLLHLNEELALLVADVHPGHAELAVVALNGTFVERKQLSLRASPTSAIRQIGNEMLKMRARHPSLTFEGVGVSLPGRVDPATQELIFAPNLRWQGQPIKQLLEKMTGLTVELENGANAALLAELWLGNLHGVLDAVLVNISEGIGTGLLANGRLVTGQSGMAGEFGHVPLDREGPRCGCGLQGCWEVFASTEAALRYYRKGNGHAPPAGSQALTFAELLRLAEQGEPAACAAITRQARAIGWGLRAVNAGLSPEVIVVAGDVAEAWEMYEPHVQQELSALALGAARAPRLMVARERGTTRLHGAAAIVLQRNSLFRSHPQR
ncbi:ROK family protein [Acidipila sp. EB88]|uniref:ROK family transcriptional regulator n=1 Tax=Acidipila sp. EB88 TaxID=2305226 RepID=UPI000F5F1CD7|nr:ROK family protein [Acidipila sp. EB88]RRA48121.1 ROK family protein [Acidipila sp. EB88]